MAAAPARRRQPSRVRAGAGATGGSSDPGQRRGGRLRAGRCAGRPDTGRRTPVSPGVHEGVVRVVASPVNAGLQPGEVLVAATTDPGWTPLFLTAGALVMEVGGVVSHGALVAREYGLPAVTAVVDATTLLETGQRVRVDGAAGTVTVLSEA